MSRAPVHARAVGATSAALLLAGLLAATPAAAATPSGPTASAPEHDRVVSTVPSALSPNVMDESVDTIYDTGDKVLAGGAFSRVRDRGSGVDIARPNLLAFHKATGQVDTGFTAAVDGEIAAIVGGPAEGTAYIAGRFNKVNGVTRRKVALINVADGSLVPSFVPPAFNGAVKDITLVSGRLLVGGLFTVAGTGHPRGGLASLDAVTGTLDGYLTTKLTEHHNWDGTSGAKGGVGVENMAISPAGDQLVVIGNFKKADGVPHDQVVKLSLGESTATIANWNTDRYTPRCAYRSFDSYVRDVAYSPDGSYFVIVTTGAGFPGTLCDSAARWESSATGWDQQPAWVEYSGGDTLLSVAISEQAVYVGGHIRWLNNPSGTDTARPGAVGRASLAALDPANGLPLAWNPGRHPRGYGVDELYLTPEGLWIGSDQSWIGNYRYRRERIAFFPLDGGAAVHRTTTVRLPGNVYQWGVPASTTGNGNEIIKRGYDGDAAVGAGTRVTDPEGIQWSAARGAFWVGGTLFYAMDSALYRRAFDGTSFGAPRLVDPYHDPVWDTVPTDSGSTTYAGVTVNFYPEIRDVTGMFYAYGRLYYTLYGQDRLYWRWFTPDSGTTGAERHTVAGAGNFATAGAVFISGDNLYLTNRHTGDLLKMGWTGTAPTGTATVVSGPAIDGVDWRAAATSLGP